ncbi:MAG TPA: YebC/PmpR family DNA-binding transcriptional regulator [Caldithrix abyssi]|uniref:Probable transcriptional regulatory protein ENL21_07715 n=1 Tax=Caldithrix abyssi TaxID=187145 RepID=A0A7V5H6Z9_CALAY|nr:YebC/PmpR family DNA-binding transcriptional regulator [Caldithrix abyssi]
MSGHSKWHSIKHKKAKVDAQRGRIFTKIIKELTVAARLGGGDPEANPRLRVAIAQAKAANMPAKNIENAIKKGTGELPGVVYEDVTYEGYGPGGVAVFVEAVTDNKNRTVAEMRHLFSKYGGNLGENGSVAWIFERKGLIRVPVDQYPEEDLLEIALECGAEDMQATDDFYEIYTSFEDFHKVRNAFEEKSIVMESAELTMIPQNTIKIEGKTAEQMLKLLEALDDHDDVQNVYANFEMEDAEMERLVSNE